MIRLARKDKIIMMDNVIVKEKKLSHVTWQNLVRGYSKTKDARKEASDVADPAC
jgi:hypothetical protein